MCKNTDKRYTVPMKNAEASVRMEGCQVTPQMREQCQRVLRGEVPTAELLRRFTKRAAAAFDIQDNGVRARRQLFRHDAGDDEGNGIDCRRNISQGIQLFICRSQICGLSHNGNTDFVHIFNKLFRSQ